MAYITSLNDYFAAPKQHISLYKPYATGCIVKMPTVVFNDRGSPGDISWYKGSTSSLATSISGDGIFVPITATTGNITGFNYHNSVVARGALYDMQGYIGTYTIPGTTSGITGAVTTTAGNLTTPAYTNQLWVSIVTGTSGSNLSLSVTYTNQDGVAGRTTGVQATSLALLANCYRMILQSGDTGVRSIQSVTSSGSTSGAYNIYILRELVMTPIPSSSSVLTRYTMMELGLPPVTSSSALLPMVISNGSTTGVSTFEIEISG